MTPTDTYPIAVTASEGPLGLEDRSAELRLTLESSGEAKLEALDIHSSERDSTLMTVWHGFDRQWSQRLSQGAAAVPDREAMQELAERLSPLLERVRAGFDEYWDGSNMRGRLVTEDAGTASEEIEALIGAADWTDGDVMVWDAYGWIVADGHDTATGRATAALKDICDMTDEEIATAGDNEVEALVKEIGKIASDDGVVFTSDVEDAVRQILAEARDETADIRAAAE